MDYINELDNLENNFREDAGRHLNNPGDVENLRVKWLGRKGFVTGFFDQLKQVPKDQKPAVGKKINQLKKQIEDKIGELQEVALRAQIAMKLENSDVDITMPVATDTGTFHPVTKITGELLRIFRNLGFSVVDGPQIESDFFNFSALNIPKDHPARDAQDTFFLQDGDFVLRTHTSNLQIHTMLANDPPIRIVAPGRVFRVDSDATHTPMFHQLECVLVDRGISFGHLKGTIDHFLGELFNKDLRTRFRPSFFPFVEPGAEIDLQCPGCQGNGCNLCKNTGWLEIGGCGMIHPNVFEAVDYDSDQWSGFAFGFGIDRIAMVAYGIDDLRHMFEADARFARQFVPFSCPEG